MRLPKAIVTETVAISVGKWIWMHVSIPFITITILTYCLISNVIYSLHWIWMTAETTQLVLSKAPISVTLGLFDNIFITDPNAKEEEIIRGRITCAIAEDDSICLLSQVPRTHASTFSSYIQLQHHRKIPPFSLRLLYESSSLSSILTLLNLALEHHFRERTHSQAAQWGHINLQAESHRNQGSISRVEMPSF